MVVKPENLPRWDGRRGWYEVWYATTNHAPSGCGFWLRYTVHVPPDPGTPGEAAVWAFAFDRAAPSFAAKHTQPLTDAKLASGSTIIELDDATLAEGRLTGTVEDDRGRTMRWALEFQPSVRAAGPLPSIAGRVAPSSYICPNLDVRASGTIDVDGTTYELSDEPLGQSHIWGRHHAGAWTWMHVHARDGLVIEALQARPHLPVIVPGVPFVLAVVDGQEHRFAAVGRGRARGRAAFPLWHLLCIERDLRLSVVVQAPPSRFVQVTYTDPGGAEAYCANTEVADATIEVSRKRAGAWRTDELIDVRDRAHVEFGAREPRPEVPVTL
jgi:hypothetical protein